MAYDEELADRIRDVLPDPELIVEKRMFGGLVFMRAGNMCCGVLKDELMLRLGPEGAQRALTQFVGPIARVLVRRAARENSSIEGLWQALSTHIELPGERAAFLRQRNE